MRRSPEAGLGFTSGTAWLDGYEDSRGFTMAEQRTDSDSVLSFHRALIALRHAHPALSLGRIVFVDEDVRDYFAYFREYEGERLFVEVNLSACALPRRHEDKPLEVLLGTAPDRSGPMHPYEAMVCRVLRG